MLWDEIERLRTVRKRLEWALKEETMIEEGIREELSQEIDLLERIAQGAEEKNKRRKTPVSQQPQQQQEPQEQPEKLQEPAVVAVESQPQEQEQKPQEESVEPNEQSNESEPEPVEQEPQLQPVPQEQEPQEETENEPARCYKCGELILER